LTKTIIAGDEKDRNRMESGINDAPTEDYEVSSNNMSAINEKESI